MTLTYDRGDWQGDLSGWTSTYYDMRTKKCFEDLEGEQSHQGFLQGWPTSEWPKNAEARNCSVLYWRFVTSQTATFVAWKSAELWQRNGYFCHSICADRRPLNKWQFLRFYSDRTRCSKVYQTSQCIPSFLTFIRPISRNLCTEAVAERVTRRICLTRDLLMSYMHPLLGSTSIEDLSTVSPSPS